ncbi:transcription factor 20 [Takifugu rubripes]|uniref:transcription factor 20 n=1 Tax=Takifugu rubripes TaxID=31033 RepID=UPI0011456AC3|nr:transcription factor 20 [Takifugu rubripes]XP_011601839.2 transcription factor 20 [Takifugu rubripes]XP_029692001.1 transcription factor 20 [Takifugu rubripes]XP_029692002.1 transcription factor 20 [Takifugu rubripes]
MQNFPNSPAPPSLPPGFSGRSGGGGPAYPPQPAEPQISPRMTDDYMGMQQQSLHRGHHSPAQASHMLAYSARTRVSAEPPQGAIHSSSSNNPYRKDVMDYYFSMGAKDRHRRGGLGYGVGFGYPNIDGHIPHQYRHTGSGSAPSSGLMSPYPLDYASGSSSGGGGGVGAFSPSQQYNMSQNPAMQSVPGSQMHHRQHGPAFHPGQQHRGYPQSGHRMTPQYPHYSPQGGTSAGSSGMYSPPPQRYLDGTAAPGFDPKVNSSPSVNSSSNPMSSSVAANNAGPMEHVQQGYHAPNYPGFSPQTLSLHKQAALQHRSSQHSLGLGYDPSVKMQHQGPSSGALYAKHHQASTLPPAASQEVAKSPLHPNAQQNQMNQNFSPISNPSPAASAVHSPSCSSSPSPLMGATDPHGNPTGHGPPHPHSANPRSNNGQGRLLQSMPQLSPTPNSNGSISSCGSGSSHKAPSMSALGGAHHPPTGRSKMGLVTGIGSREDASSVYSSSPLDKMQDAGLNSLNALSSQVANLPNTVQHMLLTDTVFSQKKAKEFAQMQQAAHGLLASQPRSRNASAASSTSTVKEGSGAGVADAGAEEDAAAVTPAGVPGAKVEREEHFPEGERGRVRQMSGASSGSEPAGHRPPSQTQSGQSSNVKTIPFDSPSKETALSEANSNDAHVPPLSSPPFGCQASEAGQVARSTPPVSSSPSSTTSSIAPTQPNCDPEPGLAHNEHRAGRRKLTEIKSEGIKKESDEVGNLAQRDREANTQNGQDRKNRPLAASRLQRNEREEKHPFEEHSGVGVIVSARSEGGHGEKSKHPQDCIEEKQPHSYLREPSTHNGEEGVDLTLYSSHHQKSNFSRNSQNPPQSGSNKFGHPESTYGSDLPVKNRGRGGSADVMESNSRYAGYQQPPSAYGPAHHKDASSVAEDLVKRGHRAGSKAQEENSQSHHFPSLLQEVLQGCNLDRRYGRPEQPYSAHPHAQQQFQARNAYDITDGMRVQSGVSEALATQVGPGKPPHPNQRHGTEPSFNTDPQSMKTELPNSKIVPNAEKSDVSGGQSHLSQSSECDPPHPKHVSAYSVPQRKALFNVSGQSSAVQELLLQESEPVTGGAGQPESQKASGSTLAPSERRSVICDVSPNRHGTPERDRESDREREKSHSAASVIQQPFSSPAAASDLSKKATAVKHAVKVEMAPKESAVDAATVHADHRDGANEADAEFHSKSVPSSVVLNADPYRRGGVDFTPVPSHPITSHSLSSPSRTPSFLHGVEISAGGGRSFPGYRYPDTREGAMMPRGSPHFPSHPAYHNLPAQAQPGCKLQTYPHARGTIHHPPDMSDWVKAMNRPPKELMMQPGSSPGKHKGGQSEQRQRLADLPVEQLAGKSSLHHQSSFYDLKMWESTHVGREGAMLIEGNPYYRTPAPPPPPPPVAPLGPFPPKLTQNAAEAKFSRGAAEDVKLSCPPAPLSSAKTSADANSTSPQVQRQTKPGSADTNPLMLRRRVRSFISPIPAKRLLQDGSQQRAASNSHHPVGAQSDHGPHNEDDSSSSDVPCPRLSSPLLRENNYSQPLSPLSAHTKALPPRKGRGLKLEAIVQKITPNIKRPPGQADDESNHYPGFSHSESFNESQEQDLAPFPRVAGGDDGYIEESSLLNDMLPFRVGDETGPLPPSAYPCDPHQPSQTLKQDFDFGLGAAVASASGEKEDFALLGPLPPPPPLPRPVQGSPPPSSSALSDIEHFTNTYQQLETRRGEHSAANLLRQKLQESGIGFDDYPGGEYYGTTPPHHGQPQGHILNRQHQMPSVRSSLSPQDSKPPESLVPKGYFPSGKKKGRPVGSVNKQKRAQNPPQPQMQGQAPAQAEGTNISAPPIPLTPTAAPVTTLQTVQTASSTPDLTLPPPTENKLPPQLAPPILTQVVKVDAESEDTQPEIDVKPARRRRKGIKDEDEPLDAKGQQGRRRKKAAASKDDAEAARANRAFADPNRKGPFIPHIHVENKVPEIGAVCTIVNAEEDKTRGERATVAGKASGSGIDSLLTSALSSQLSRRDRESEKREADEVESPLQSGKALPSSGHVVVGPVITETNHSGRLLCCLCQKWANYKNLGDLYGPFYPAEYAAKLPKNQPQVRQCQATAGTNKTGPNTDIISNTLNSSQEAQTQDAYFTQSDYAIGTDSTSLTAAVRPVSTATREETMTHLAGRFSNAASSLSPSSSYAISKPTSLTWDMNLQIHPIPELKREAEPDIDQQWTRKQPQLQLQLQPTPDEAQQRPQHRKLTSHPRFKRRHKSSEDCPRMVPSNSKASLPFQPPPPALDSLGPLAQLAQLPKMPMDPEELWVHEGCIVWTSGVYLVSGRLYGLQEALDGARETCCSYCEMVGSTLGCYSKGCTLRYHYLCAIEADCSLNEDNFSLRCPKHKVTQSIRPSKLVYMEQSERG